ncbi:hypothetical protein GCM10022215_14290 [Nocardioides fonticola]|uniref:Uncharacterized protein n=1 Tax=Nocardioides fonticola TaxID=450363 RepID=A0ABP7XG92_9ACTN
MAVRPHLPLEAFARASGWEESVVRDLVADGRLDGVRTDDGVLFAILTDRLPADVDPAAAERIAAATTKERAPDDAPTGEGWTISW